MKFKVAELPHAFFNGLAVSGASAGEHASVNGETLFHSGQVVAAAILRDANHADGRRVAIIAPQYQDNDSRWGTGTLSAAVPPSLAKVEFSRWPHAVDIRRGFAPLAESAVSLVAAYTSAIDSACRAAIHSETDAEGDRPNDVPAYFAAVRDILALAWSDPVARENARLRFVAMRDKWQLAETGEYDLTIVRAIAQRERIMENAARSLPLIREYFSAHADVSTLAARLRLVERFRKAELCAAIAQVCRAGIPATDSFPANMLAVVESDFAKCERAERIRRCPRAVREGWRRAARGEYTTARMGETSPDVPMRHVLQFRAAAEFGSMVATRNAHKAAIREYDLKLSEAETARAAFGAIVATMDAGQVPADLSAVMDVCARIERAAAEYATGDSVFYAARDVEAFAPRYPALHSAAGQWWQNEENRADLRKNAASIRAHFAAAIAQAEQEANRARWRAQLAEHIATIPTMPRAALAAIRSLSYNLSSYDAGRRYGSDRSALTVEADDAITQAQAAQNSVSEVEEWNNGGSAPSGGDWLRVRGSRCQSSRGVEVATRAVRVAFAWLDSQPAGAVQAPPEFEVNGYRLYGRDADGAVQVGCHRFSAEAVADIRRQLAQGETA